ncbi:MAG TPA: cyclopropane-fatty-acyl-phospholipid synthase family protein [Methylocella sp.]|nr:cyclopropane-fatty-acyl-phospholipid synthase family protein [Methylocella sp.]
MIEFVKTLFTGFIKNGSLELELPRNYRFVLGDGFGQQLGLRCNDWQAIFELLTDPEFQFGQLYMDGRLEVTKGTIYDVLMLIAANFWRPDRSRWLRVLETLKRLRRVYHLSNNRQRARSNAAHHYDFDAAFYSRFLDSGLQYSCAYFERGGQNLENAQLAKKRHLAAKLLIEPGQTVLDIGCGFGGLAIYLARFCGASVTGITLSQTQLNVARSKAAELGFAGVTDFRFSDYRDLTGHFGRIVSVGMFEHVGKAYYPAFFQKIMELLDEEGVALIHTIGRADGPCLTNPWVEKYIFPGGYMPSLSEIMPAIEKSGLFVTDIEILRLHYAETLKAWRARFLANRATVAVRKGELFCRMWELYLAGCECAFRCEGLVNFQIQLSKKLGTVPLTRDYIGEAEAHLRQRDSAEVHLRLVGE